MKLSPHAAEFSPINKNASIRSALNESWQTPTKVKKTKGERSKPRKRRRPKKSISILKDSPPTTSDASDAYHNLIPGEAMPHLTSESLGGQEKLKDCIIPGNDDVWTEDIGMFVVFEGVIFYFIFIFASYSSYFFIARRMWSDWAIFAAEVERKRRIQLWEAMEEEQLQEREAMGKLAISLMETERSQRMTQHFAIDTANSNWFNAMFLSLESAGSMSLMDYEIKCPYHYRGCEASCRRSTLSHHLKYDCHCAAEVYHGDRVVSHSTEVNCDDMGSNYEVICPNSCLGCKHICQFGDIYDHLCTCEFSGYVSSEQQELERRYREQSVISQCEVERNRRVKADRFRSRHKCRSPVRNMLRCEDGDVRSGEGMEAGNDPIYTPSNEHLMSLHMLLVLQREILLSSLYKQVIERFTNREYVFSTYMQPNIDRVVDKVKDVIEGGITSWFACSEEGSVGKCRVESYGSYATGPHCIPSNLYQEAFLHWRGISIPMNESVGECDDSFDVDLVVCPDDFGYEYLFGGSGTSSTVSALIERLAEFLGGNSELVGIKVKSVVPHAHIPVIKVTAEYNVPELSNICFASGGRFQFCIDITLQSPHHLGVAAREMLTCLSASLSPFLPVAYIMKEYFKRLGLCGDAFQGGLPSYGLMIMTLLPVLQYLNRCNDFSGEGEPCSTGAKAEQGGEFKFPGMDSVSLLGDSAILDNMLPSTTCVAGLPSLSEGMFAPDCLNVDESPNVGIRRRSYSTPMPVTEANKSCQLTSGRGRYATINRCRLHGRRVALQLLGKYLGVSAKHIAS